MLGFFLFQVNVWHLKFKCWWIFLNTANSKCIFDLLLLQAENIYNDEDPEGADSELQAWVQSSNLLVKNGSLFWFRVHKQWWIFLKLRASCDFWEEKKSDQNAALSSPCEIFIISPHRSDFYISELCSELWWNCHRSVHQLRFCSWWFTSFILITHNISTEIHFYLKCTYCLFPFCFINWIFLGYVLLVYFLSCFSSLRQIFCEFSYIHNKILTLNMFCCFYCHSISDETNIGRTSS